MSRTYYDLQPFHYEIINDAGYKIGDVVWFPDQFDDIHKGIIKSFDVHLDGDVMFNIDYEETQEWKLSKEIWTTNEKDYDISTTVDMSTEKCFMHRVAKSESEVKILLIKRYEFKISQHKTDIVRLEGKISELKSPEQT